MGDVEQDKYVFGQRFDAAERRRHEFAVVDELSHQTYDHIVAVVEASYFRGADVVAITDVETQSPLVFDVFQQLTANLARDYREAALAIDKVSGVCWIYIELTVFLINQYLR